MLNKKMIIFFLYIFVVIVVLIVIFLLKNKFLKNNEQVTITLQDGPIVYSQNELAGFAEELMQKDKNESKGSFTSLEIQNRWINLFGKTSYYDYLWEKFLIYNKKEIEKEPISNGVVYDNDFNNDGINEKIYYYEIIPPDLDTNENGPKIYKIKVYRYSLEEKKWIKDYEDFAEDYQSLFNPSEFFTAVDIDKDGFKEVVIKKILTSVGSVTEKYILKWDGKKILKISLPKISDLIKNNNLKKYLSGDHEAFGIADFTNLENGGQIVLHICDERTACVDKESGLGALGRIFFNLKFENNIFTIDNLKIERF